MALWFRWIIYVACLVLAVGYAVLFILVSAIAVGTNPFVSLGSIAVLVVPALVLPVPRGQTLLVSFTRAKRGGTHHSASLEFNP
jgi:hypothetical protein